MRTISFWGPGVALMSRMRLPAKLLLLSAMLLVPWQVGVNALARGGRTRGESRDRVLLVADLAEQVRQLRGRS